MWSYLLHSSKSPLRVACMSRPLHQFSRYEPRPVLYGISNTLLAFGRWKLFSFWIFWCLFCNPILPHCSKLFCCWFYEIGSCDNSPPIRMQLGCSRCSIPNVGKFSQTKFHWGLQNPSLFSTVSTTFTISLIFNISPKRVQRKKNTSATHLRNGPLLSPRANSSFLRHC